METAQTQKQAKAIRADQHQQPFPMWAKFGIVLLIGWFARGLLTSAPSVPVAAPVVAAATPAPAPVVTPTVVQPVIVQQAPPTVVIQPSPAPEIIVIQKSYPNRTIVIER